MGEQKKINDGGIAFPVPAVVVPEDGTIVDDGANGMTLRDYFADSALAAIIAKIPLCEEDGQGFGKQVTLDQAREIARLTARGAYIYADAMIVERGRV